jgi:RNA 2',3'-cyclic 3'-phosphodiesterase
VPSMPQAPVTGAMLWSSVLTPRGPIYEPLAAYPLRAA